MKEGTKEVVFALLMGIVAPWLILGIAAANTPADSLLQTEHSKHERTVYTLTVLKDEETVEMDLEEYLVGVLLCEIPESFDMEAKKAQAVVARTYALRTATVKDKHPNQGVCTSPDCCQGYIDPEEYGGSKEGIEQARQAVASTEALVLTYEAELIDATYFSCSGGMTEDALAVWGAEIPYLQAVTSPGEEQANYYTDTVSFTAEQFCSALGVQLSGSSYYWLGDVTYTDGGGVDTMVIGGMEYKGTQLRSLLGLRSTAFRMYATGEQIVVTTRGFGHRVGMSQYGAEAMAVSGSKFDEILKHYYQGTELTHLE